MNSQIKWASHRGPFNFGEEKQPTLRRPKPFFLLTGVSAKRPPERYFMIISIPVDINLVFLLLKKFPWPRPDHCPNCNNPSLWGHGFVDACFDGIKSVVPLKRYRCCNCGCTIKLKPEGYFKRFQASVETIRNSIDSILTTGKPIKDTGRQRQRHWFIALKRKATAVLALGLDLKQAFERLIVMGFIPVSRAI